MFDHPREKKFSRKPKSLQVRTRSGRDKKFQTPVLDALCVRRSNRGKPERLEGLTC